MCKQIYICENIELYRDNEELILKVKASLPFNLWKGSKPIAESLTTKVLEGEAGTYTLHLPVEQLPCYFLLQSKEERIIFSERLLPLKGAINVRDMGGYKTTTGKQVKWGLLYRGDQLSKLVERDVQLLNRIGIKTVIDYRSEHERSINPNIKIDTLTHNVYCDPHSSFSEAAAQAVDLASENQKLVSDLKAGKIDSEYVNGTGLKVIKSYEELVVNKTSIKAYKKMLETYADINFMPSIQHCRGGKDRTGFGSMLLLMLLGVCEEEIVKDYTMTGIIREKRNNFKLNQYKELTDNQDYLDYLMSMIETRADYIQASMNRINHEFNGIENYVKNILGLNDNQIESIKANYLEEV